MISLPSRQSVLSRGASLLPLLSRVVPATKGICGDIAKPGVTELGYDWLPLRATESLRQLWSLVRPELGRIRQPLLMFRSRTDHVVETINARLVLDGVASADITDVVLPDSFHVATLDYDAPGIFASSVEFVQRVHDERAREVV